MQKGRPILMLAACLLVMAAGVGCLGTMTVRNADHDPNALEAGVLLAWLREGQTLALYDVFPEEWDEVQFALGEQALTVMERDALYRFRPAYAQSPAQDRWLLFWTRDRLTYAVHYPAAQEGYPRFVDSCVPLPCESFSLDREAAVFRCDFVSHEKRKGGYYRLSPVEDAVEKEMV